MKTLKLGILVAMLGVSLSNPGFGRLSSSTAHSATGVTAPTTHLTCTNPNLGPDPGGPYTGVVGQPVSVVGSNSTDQDDGGLTKFNWSFGDGGGAYGLTYGNVDTTHTYTAAGTYTVRLTEWNTLYAGLCTAQTTATITN